MGDQWPLCVFHALEPTDIPPSSVCIQDKGCLHRAAPSAESNKTHNDLLQTIAAQENWMSNVNSHLPNIAASYSFINWSLWVEGH